VIAAISCTFGVGRTLLCLGISTIIGSILALYKLIQKRLKKDNSLPFIPLLTSAYFVTLFLR
jgi:prepilin signal peptidase PulO-like enzyme (type II secretory pathway)